MQCRVGLPQLQASERIRQAFLADVLAEPSRWEETLMMHTHWAASPGIVLSMQ